MASPEAMQRMKMVLRESDVPFFTDEELEFYLKENDEDVDAAIYQCLIVKSEDTSLSVSGMTAADSSSYFKRLAQRYRPNNSGILLGG